MQPFSPVEALFKGRHFDGQIIILCVSWYTSFKLSLRDLVLIMTDRGITLTHTTILRWVQHFLPEFEKRWSRYAHPVGGSWRMDEIDIKVRRRWVYLYRAVDKAGQTVDFYPEPKPRCECSQELSPPCDEEPAHTQQDHARCLCGVASRRAGNAGDRRTSTPSQGAIEPILEQSRRAGPPPNQTADSADAGIQTIRPRGSHHYPIRVSGEDQEGPVQDGQVRESEIYYVGTLERCPCRLTIADTHLQQSSLRSGASREFAPEPDFLGRPHIPVCRCHRILCDQPAMPGAGSRA